MLKLFLVLLTGLFFGCLKPVDLGERSFIGATRIGDVLKVDINKEKINFQLEGKMSGTAYAGKLKPVPKQKNIYRVEEMRGLKIAMIPDELIIYGVKRKNLAPKFGVALKSTKPYDKQDIAGIYNFVVQYCPANFNKYSYGTFEISADQTWRMWKMKDGLQIENTPRITGYWVDKHNGIIQAFLDNKTLYANIAFSQESDENIMVVNIISKNGLALGVKRNTIKPGSADGDYNGVGSNGNSVKIAIERDQVATQGKKQLALKYNEPWDGFVKDHRGEFLAVVSPGGTCFGLNIGTISRLQFIFAALKDK